MWHAYSTYDALSIDTKVDDIGTLTVTFMLILAFEDFADGAYYVTKNLVMLHAKQFGTYGFLCTASVL